MAGRGDKIWHHDTEVKPNYEKLDELFERKGMIPEGYEEYKRAGKMATYSQVLRWTRSVGSGGAKPYVINADFDISRPCLLDVTSFSDKKLNLSLALSRLTF